MDEQAKIFAKNLNRFIAESGKTQKEVAKELGFNPTTFNTWCVGKILPRVGRIQRIADYFHVPKSALTDEQPESIPILLITDFEVEIINAYRASSKERQESILLLLGLQK